ncbi:hypothetical protein L6164_011298 [Bauhinia variegata]|uniref:Uncharacterized protein n=1 Tax=Bauhinia variegata TaxID=167791 RepID=A0ACB9P6R2_BAUVA|nr:hypothetical protein L6164_011298 [Bauhinia variegata]
MRFPFLTQDFLKAQFKVESILSANLAGKSSSCGARFGVRMEGSESEAMFDSLNLNPQLFINEVLNTVDDVVDDAFDFFYQEASTKLKTERTEASQDLRKGVDGIRNVIQSVLDKRLAIWEKYSLYHCFSVPQGFALPKSDESTEDGAMYQDALSDPDIDAELDIWRKKLAAVTKEFEMLNQELQALEKRSPSSVEYINEALQSYEQNSLHQLFQEVVANASELGTKIGRLNTSMIEETNEMKMKEAYKIENDLSAMDPTTGLSNAKFEDLQQFLAVMKSM